MVEEAGRSTDLSSTPGGEEWRFRFPNTADFNFNYWKLLNDARGTAIAKPPSNADQLRIAIVGAGVAGLTAARELFRSGFRNIDIYEASERIGGRTYSQASPLPGDITTFEMGAMRVPFFWPESTPKEHQKLRGSKNAVIDEYCCEFDIRTEPFPNPGSENVSTGVYINRGYGAKSPEEPDNPDAPKRLIFWEKSPQGQWEPDDAELREIQRKWKKFENKFKDACRKSYSDSVKWSQTWQAILREYQRLSFRQLVLMQPRSHAPGNFGGPGLDPSQARILAVVGMGDGGWGAFYDISCLYVLRIVMFGFFDNLQMIVGKIGKDEKLSIAPEQIPCDSAGKKLATPRFLGVQSLAECLFYRRSLRYNGAEESLYEAMDKARGSRLGVHLYVRTPVRGIRRLGESGQIRISTEVAAAVEYDEVIVTAMPWSLEVESTFDRFRPSQLPWKVRDAMKSSHFITSCKVFFPLKELYWLDSGIPQVIITDTFLQGAYGIAISETATTTDRAYKGVLLASYTWEDDATKLLADNDDRVAERCLDELDAILMRCIERTISPYVIKAAPRVIHWARSPHYRGCARLYRPGSWDLDRSLLTYNREYSAKSHLYLAGEAYSVEGGWVEPALRSALDAVIHLVHNRNGTFSNKFNFQLYPCHSR
jgi:tryptophan 2-monooxygenase